MNIGNACILLARANSITYCNNKSIQYYYYYYFIIVSNGVILEDYLQRRHRRKYKNIIICF